MMKRKTTIKGQCGEKEVFIKLTDINIYTQTEDLFYKSQKKGW